MTQSFETIEDVSSALESVGYLPSKQIASTVFLAMRLSKPVLIEGPAGTGKTELAKAVSAMAESELIRLQCYEGLDESKALFEWNYRKQLLRIQSERHLIDGTLEPTEWSSIEEDIFSPDFLLERPLLKAIRSVEPSVLLIDEVDRMEAETEALLLEVLSEFQISIPELGTVKATTKPLVFLTSNGTRDLSEALKRRCLFLFLDYPDPDRERDILLSKVANLPKRLGEQIASFAAALRALDLKKKPSISETLDWAFALLELGHSELDAMVVEESLYVLLKYRNDIDLAMRELNGMPGMGRG